MLLTIVFILIGLAVGFSVKMMFFRPDGARGVVAFFVASLFWLIAAPAIPAVMEIQFGKLGNWGPHVFFLAMGVFLGVKK